MGFTLRSATWNCADRAKFSARVRPAYSSFRIADLARDAVLIPEVLARGQRLLREDPATAQRLLRTWAPADTGSISV